MPNPVTSPVIYSSPGIYVNLRGQKSPGIPYIITSYMHLAPVYLQYNLCSSVLIFQYL